MATTGSRLVLARHGLTDWNESGRLMGRSDAIGLNARGQAQANALGAALASRRPDLMLSSPRRRTRETAEAIARVHGIAVETDEALDEVWLGRWQGRTVAEIKDDPDLVQWLADPTHGSDAIEGAAAVQRRMATLLDRVRALGPGRLVVAVSHGDPLRLLVTHVLGMRLTDYRCLDIRPGSITVLDVGPAACRLLALGWRPGAAPPGL